jgi:hypothetical protein
MPTTAAVPQPLEISTDCLPLALRLAVIEEQEDAPDCRRGRQREEEDIDPEPKCPWQLGHGASPDRSMHRL